jgi:fructuronate reductase
MNAGRRLSAATLALVPPEIAVPNYDVDQLKSGIVHLGVGAFHRCHQAIITEDAINDAVGSGAQADWGIVGASLRSADVKELLEPQDNLYTVDYAAHTHSYRVIGLLRDVIVGPAAPQRLLGAIADQAIHVITLTVTEKAYRFGPDGLLQFDNPEIVADLSGQGPPRSVVGWLAHGLHQRLRGGGAPMSVISCDNLACNGEILERAVLSFAERYDLALARWIAREVTFPNSVVDCIVPASDAALRNRVAAAIGMEDHACVQREPYSQWVIQNRFAGPRPQWERGGAEIVEDVASYGLLKLRVLNAAHSALAYLGLGRGHDYVFQAVADRELMQQVDEMILAEVAPACAKLDVAGYWKITRERFANPGIFHRLSQIAEDGSKKLVQRIFPTLIGNAAQGLPYARLADTVRAWLKVVGAGHPDPQRDWAERWFASGGDIEAALENSDIFPDPFRTDAALRRGMGVR